MGFDRSLRIGLVLLLFFFITWALGLGYVTTETNQGEIYRIIYLHVPSAFAAFFSGLMLFIFSIQGLRTASHANYRNDIFHRCKSCAEVGLLFTFITLSSGAIWGKPTWGVWWTWDARLTTTFILFLMYCGFILLSIALPRSQARTKICSVLGILIFSDIPIIYKSVTWWRTLHQPPSLFRQEGPAMSLEILLFLSISCLATLSLTAWLVFQRSENLLSEENIRDIASQK